MSTKHSPGPWSIKEVKDNFQHTSVFVPVDSNNISLLTCFSDVCENDFPAVEFESDARLISAAPELLWVARLAISPFDGKPDSECPNWVKPARAAIAKATGEQA